MYPLSERMFLAAGDHEWILKQILEFDFLLVRTAQCDPELRFASAYCLDCFMSATIVNPYPVTGKL